MKIITYLLIYAIVGIVIGIVVYWQTKNLSEKKRRCGSITSGILWPIIFGLVIVMVLEDVRDKIRDRKNGRY